MLHFRLFFPATPALNYNTSCCTRLYFTLVWTLFAGSVMPLQSLLFRFGHG